MVSDELVQKIADMVFPGFEQSLNTYEHSLIMRGQAKTREQLIADIEKDVFSEAHMKTWPELTDDPELMAAVWHECLRRLHVRSRN